MSGPETSRRPSKSFHGPTHSSRRGLTLFELILAIALAAVVWVLIAQMVRLQLRMVDVGRTELEETQLARAVLRRIADDLSAAVYAEPADLTAVKDLAALGISDDDDLDSSTDEAETDDLASSLAPPDIPGLYGNQYELQVDISRLPRLDEYLPQVSLSAATDLPSDLKTVTWYLISADANSEFAGTAQVTRDPTMENDSADAGLFRRALDRSAALFAVENGTVARLDTSDAALAPEVTQLEFRYFDGAQWQTEWDSAENGGLPMAVRVAIAIRPQGVMRSTRLSTVVSADTDETENGDLVYTLTVHLPLAEPTNDEQVEQGELQ